MLIEHVALAEACLEMGLTVDLARPNNGTVMSTKIVTCAAPVRDLLA